MKAAQAKAQRDGVETLTQKDIEGLSLEQMKQLRGTKVCTVAAALHPLARAASLQRPRHRGFRITSRRNVDQLTFPVMLSA